MTLNPERNLFVSMSNEVGDRERLRKLAMSRDLQQRYLKRHGGITA